MSTEERKRKLVEKFSYQEGHLDPDKVELVASLNDEEFEDFAVDFFSLIQVHRKTVVELDVEMLDSLSLTRKQDFVLEMTYDKAEDVFEFGESIAGKLPSLIDDFEWHCTTCGKLDVNPVSHFISKHYNRR